MIAAGDAQSITAAELNAINGATSLAVDASAVRAITYDTLENINILMTNATDTSQFSSGSFSNLSSVQVFNVEQYMRYPDLKAAFVKILIYYLTIILTMVNLRIEQTGFLMFLI